MTSVGNVQNTAIDQLFSSYANSAGSGTGGAVSQSDFSSLLLMAYSQGVADTKQMGSAAYATMPATFTPYIQTQETTEVLGVAGTKYQPEELIGKFVKGFFNGSEYSGYVVRIFSENGVQYAELNDGRSKNKAFPIASITEVLNKGPYPNSKYGDPPGSDWRHIKSRGYIQFAPNGKEYGYWEFERKDWQWYLIINESAKIPNPPVPAAAKFYKADPKGGFIEYTEDYKTEVGHWDWIIHLQDWLYTAYKLAQNTPPAADDLTGAEGEELAIGESENEESAVSGAGGNGDPGESEEFMIHDAAASGITAPPPAAEDSQVEESKEADDSPAEEPAEEAASSEAPSEISGEEV